jgi:subtilisin family serine protease
MSGTSMATPHVAGLAALLFQAKPNASVQAIERAIFRSCTPLSGTPPKRQGRGFPNGPTALAAL